MNGIERTVNLLRGSGDPQARTAMRAGISEMDWEIQAATISSLLTYRDSETPRLIIENMQNLGEPALLVLRNSGADALRGYIRANLHALSGELYDNAVYFMSLTGSADTLDMLVLGLASQEASSRAKAAEAILAAMRKYAKDHAQEAELLSERRVNNRRRAQVLRSLEKALDDFPEHGERFIFEAIMLMGPRGHTLLNKILLETAHPRRVAVSRPASGPASSRSAAKAAKRDPLESTQSNRPIDDEAPAFLLRAKAAERNRIGDPPEVEPLAAPAETPEPKSKPAARVKVIDARRELILEELRVGTSRQAMAYLIALGVDGELHGVASEIIGLRQGDPEFIDAIVPAVVEMELKDFNFLLARCAEFPWIDWVVSRSAPMAPADALNAMRFVLRGTNPIVKKGEWLEQMYENPANMVRMHVLNQFESLESTQAWRIAIRALHDHDHPEIQLQAIDVVLEHRKDSPLPITKLLSPLLSADQSRISMRVAGVLAKLGLEGYMQAYYKMSKTTRERVALVLAKLQPGVRQTVLAELTDLESSKKLACLEFLKCLGEERAATDLLGKLMRDPDRKVRATVVNILGTFGTIKSVKILIEALQDPDTRVRANVIESLGLLPAPAGLVKLLLPYLEDTDNRIRGNAIRALWNLGYHETQGVINEMLEAEQEGMRLTGLWLVGEFNLMKLRPKLQGIAANDSSAVVCQKAMVVLEQMVPEKP